MLERNWRPISRNLCRSIGLVNTPSQDEFWQAVICPIDMFLVEIALYLSSVLLAGYALYEVLA